MDPRCAALAVLLALGNLALGAPARADLAALLRRSETADARVDYSGTKVISSTHGHHHPGPRERTVRVWHHAPDRTRIEFVAGGPPGGMIIEHGNDKYFRGPHGDFRRFPREPQAGGIDLLLRNYVLRKIKAEPVAGRPALEIGVEPRHPGNPHKIVWIDLQTALTLKTQLFSSSGQLTEEWTFTEITLHPAFEAQMFDVPLGAQPIDPPPPTSLNFTPKRPGYLPPGYMLVTTTNFTDHQGRLVACLRFTDGLNTLSLFETRAGTGDDPEWFRGHAVTGLAGDVRFAIVADLSPAELNNVARSLSPPR